MGLISFITGSDNRKHLKKLEAIALKVEDYDEAFRKLSDDELKAKTEEFRRRYKENYESLDDLLPEAFATVREASARVLGMRHFHVQILGGITLHQGRIAEMRTGEGKTLVSTLPAYLNAITGEGVHIVTVNDYLAKRDAEWMGKVHRFLGLTVGVAVSGMTPEAKRAAYNCDITYATNNELGFDYLRDNMVIYKEEMVQRKLSYAVIDEVDSILIDEARTPLIISGRGEKSSDLYVRANQFVKREIKEDDYEYDEKKKAINLTESGSLKAETFFGVDNLADIENSDISHHVNNALRAHKIMKRDQDYIVSDGEVVIVDEFTGRLMVGRRYSDGLHQAIEAKENVTIRNENKTLATITFQNYFRLYDKLGGMTGTAKTEESEFKGIYGLDVVEIPTNVPSQRVDENDVIYTTVNGKLRAVIEDIRECTHRGQPVLVGTTNVEKSEELSRLLTGQRINHNVLNAKNHEKEAEIIAQAGRVGAVTIATNMAGRGTDILLGGNPEYLAKKRMRDLGVDEKLISASNAYFITEDPDILAARAQYKKFYDEYKKEADEEKEKVIAVGGLRIIGTERHESRRIDNQLRGRAGRQGDIGSSIFYLSMEDDVLRLFGGDRMKRIAELFRADEDTPFSMKLLTRQIANAQRNIEGRNYSIRKQVLEYDNVMNTQRTIIYKERNKVLQGESVHEQIDAMMHEQIEKVVDTYTDSKVDWNEWDYESLNKEIERKLIPGDTTFLTEDRMEKWALEEIKEQIYTAMQTYYTQKVDNAKELGVDFEEIERVILLKVVDKQWMDHIDAMDALRRGIGLKAYGQQDPVIAYKQEGFAMFDDMIDRIHEETIALLMRVNVERAPKREGQNLDLVVSSGGSKQAKAPKVNQNENKNVGRNDSCPCGSGKKYKNCCWDKDHK